MEKEPRRKIDEEIFGEIVDDIIIDKFESSKDSKCGCDAEIFGEIVDDFIIDKCGAITPEAAEKLHLELAAAKELNDLCMDKIRHQAAEFENYRNRTSKEMGQIFDKGVREVVSALLPIIDNFALAVKNADKKDPFAAGMMMIQSQLHTMLENLGIEKIPAVGEKFDTKYHSAVSHIKDESLDEGVVAEELQGGYVYKGSVIRHAVVVVAN
ncbi:MAG: nucleotide exchange factor GrpE [Clostridiales bacterium]|jgi:molecular chaperone GrpE (heat shock protein)|nr:nucleotide exchange factor GrpE [Clostridiales bacterium]